MYRIPALVLTASMLTGCARDLSSMVPYDVGLIWTAAESRHVEEISWRAVAGTAPVVADALIGAGESCGDAQTIAHGITTIGDETVSWHHEVVGNTVSHHPLKPGEDAFNNIGVSVVAETFDAHGQVTITEDFAGFDEDADIVTWEEVVSALDTVDKGARYHGVAADEYIVSLSPLGLWTDWEADDTDDYEGSDAGEMEGDEDGARNLFLLSKHKPKKGDLWTSLNGNSLYVYDGTEELNVGGKNVKTDRVLVYTTTNFDAAAGEVIADCLSVDPFEFQTTQDDVDSLLTETVSLIDGCQGDFMHHQIGTQWWYGNTLVQFNGSQVFVEVDDYGWEWYLDDEDTDTCARVTDRTKPTNRPNAVLFAHYTVRTETTDYVVDSWEVVSGKDAAE